ncbi:class I SAM-dependent methyltransferase [Alkalibacillus silvisoli]|uniref:Methyltransferase type 11 domain-containing protein n=1 Tax=Alkalibacillus silvisoli TaxID=392823 RepID=A0ABN0ZN98_9BACI
MKSLYDTIGKDYDTTRKADPEITRRLTHHLQIPSESKVLDVACGTGNYTVAIQESGLQMVGCDISNEMLTRAKGKSQYVQWDYADVTQLPYSDHSFDGVTCILSIHHFDDLVAAFKEVYRVIDQGRFVIFTSDPNQMNNYWLKEYFPKAIEQSAKKMPGISNVNEILEDAGFEIVGQETFLIQPSLQDFFLYSGKFDPHMYLDEKVRSGISTFANIASEEEINEGCRRLSHDIETNRIEYVLAKHSSVIGDYVYIVAEKN